MRWPLPRNVSSRYEITSIFFRMRIKELCKERGITQEDLARRLGIRPSSLSQAISRNRLSAEYLERIADALKVSVGELFEHEPTIVCPHCGRIIRLKAE